MGAAHVLRNAGRKSRYMFTHTNDRNNDETFCYGTALKRHFLWRNQGMRVVRVREHHSVLGFLLSQKRRRHLRQHQENRRNGRTNMALTRPDEHLDGFLHVYQAKSSCLKLQRQGQDNPPRCTRITSIYMATTHDSLLGSKCVGTTTSIISYPQPVTKNTEQTQAMTDNSI